MNKPLNFFLLPACLCAVSIFALSGCGSGGVTSNNKGLSANSGGAATATPPNAEPETPPAPITPAPATTAPSTAASGATMSGGLKNGLFPQFGTPIASSFGGGLFPQGIGTESASSVNSDRGTGSDTTAASLSANNEGPTWTPESPTAKSGMTKMALKDKASQAFARHKEADAMNLLYAHVLVSDDQNQYPLKWVKKLAEPRVALRWGVGVNFKKQNTVTGRFSVIGDPGGDEGAGGRSGRGSRLGSIGSGGGGASRSSARKYKQMDTSRPDGFLMYYTGDFGEAFIGAIDKRRKHSDAFYGTLLKDVEMVVPDPENASSQEPTNSGGATTTIEGLGDGGGGGGDGGGTQRKRANGNIIDRAKGSGDSKTPDDELVGTIVPGVMLVGQDKPAELISRAREQSLDILALFIVNAKQSKKGEKTSMTSLRFIDLRKDDVEPMYKSKQLKDTKVAEALEDDRDLVEMEIDRAFKTFADEEGLKTGEMPKGIKAKHVKNRVNKILEKDLPNPLPACVEVVGFYRLNLIDQEFASSALNKLLDSDQGADLLSDNPEKRMAAIAEWLPADTSDNDDDL